MGRRDYATVGSVVGGDGVEDGVAMTHSNFRDDMIHDVFPRKLRSGKLCLLEENK